MVWQDIVISLASLILMLSLLPQIHYSFKNKKGTITIKTSLPTFIGLYTIAASYFTIELYYSFIVTFLTATFWLILFVQRLIYKK